MSKVSPMLYRDYENFKQACKDFKQLTFKYQLITTLAVIALSLLVIPVIPFVVPKIFTKLVTFFKPSIPKLPPEIISHILGYVDTPTISRLAEYQIDHKMKLIKSESERTRLTEFAWIELFKRNHRFRPDQSSKVFNKMILFAEKTQEFNIYGFKIEERKLEDFFKLPGKNLKSLSLEATSISQFPKDLKTLRLRGSCSLYIDPEWIRKLPSLETLSIRNGIFSSLQGPFPSLPTSIRHLDMGECKLFFKFTDILPRGLISLSLSHLYPNAISRLPSSLTTLSLQSFGSSEMQDEHLMLLPKSIVNLTLKYFSSITNEGLAKLSDSLQHLCLWYCEKITDGCFPYLPKSLKSLECYLAGCSDSQLSPILEPSNVGLKIIKQNIQQLPKALTSLSLTHLSWLLPECIFYFPPSLTHLNVAYSHRVLNLGSIKDLPKGLKTLVLSKNFNLLNVQEYSELLKRNIKVLYRS